MTTKGDAMKRGFLLMTILAVLMVGPVAADHRIGAGLHHWQTVDDLADDGFEGIEDEGTSGIVSYQYMPEGIFSLELDLEYFADGFGGSTEEAFSPQAYLLVGHGLYAGAGVGVTHSDGETSDMFYAARIGFDISIIPRLSLDVNANYRFDDWDLVDEVETDTVTLGALIRLRL
ncbi:MAG TPA: hypothetical protein VN493_07020 [Thermoanaerobaculia bacterium]|nr:hypothetical protein [Thermoanaerobaculia bacterium]